MAVAGESWEWKRLMCRSQPHPQVPADVGQKRRRGEAESLGAE